MVKIAHIADTHLSHRRRIDVRDEWKEDKRLRLIEYDFNRAFQNAMEMIAASQIDYLVHAGDLFDVPVGRNLSSPSEYSRAFIIQELQKFFQKTSYKIPLIIIDGNHGTFLTRNNSTLEFVQAAFPDHIHLATNYDLKKAIVNDNPLIVEFEEVNFYLFPYLDFSKSSKWKKMYDNWMLNNQKPAPDKVSIAIVHGMQKGKDLPDLLFEFNYDYVALGHNHQQVKIAENMWFSGSMENLTFAERNQVKGFLEVNITKDHGPIVFPKKIGQTRKMKQFEIIINKDMTSLDLEKAVREKMSTFKETFDKETAARLKFAFKGTVFLTQWWNFEDLLVEIQKDAFSNEYNILEFRWDTRELDRTTPVSVMKGAKIQDYLIEDPVKDFERYIRSLSLEDQLKAQEYITKGAEIIKSVFGSSEIGEEEI